MQAHVELSILKQKNPEIAKFLESWKDRYENRSYDFKEAADQADFYEAMNEIALHIAHSSASASLSTIVGQDGVNTVYVRITPKS